MKKSELLKIIDEELIGKLYGFCYDRTDSSYEAEELCSDIIFALVKAANTDGEIEAVYPFVWKVARNTYADFSEKRRRESERTYENDPDELLSRIPYSEDEDTSEDDRKLLLKVYRHIAFLTRAYREVMIAYYLDGKPIAEIAKEQNTSEGAIRQRLFSARDTVRKGVNSMENNTKPLAFEKIELCIIGSGDPVANDPREVADRQLSQHVVWMCRGKEMNAKTISEALNVPAAYIEEELEIQVKGKNGKYGLLKKLDNGKYTTNFILLDEKEVKEAQDIYIGFADEICDVVAKFVAEYEEEYLSIPYLNKNADMNQILWVQFYNIANYLGRQVNDILANDHFSDIKLSSRPFSVYGYRASNVKNWSCGKDGIFAKNICGYSSVYLSNIYTKPLKAKFHCGHNIATDEKIHLAIRAIDGISIDSLTEDEKEIAAKAIQKGYIYRDGDMLYTRILTIDSKDEDRFYDISKNSVCDNSKNILGYLRPISEKIAERVATFIREHTPEHLLSDYRYVKSIAGLPMFETLLGSLIEKGLLKVPEGGFGPEGVIMILEK